MLLLLLLPLPLPLFVLYASKHLNNIYNGATRVKCTMMLIMMRLGGNWNCVVVVIVVPAYY